MNRRFVPAFAAVCLVAALASAASVAYRVLAADSGGRGAARADFEALASILGELRNPSELGNPSLRARLASHFAASAALLLVDVYERGAGDRWRMPADSAYLPSSGTSGQVPAPSYPPASTILLSSPLKSDSSGALAVDALYTTVTQQTVFVAFRDALMGLAAFLALAALVLAFVTGGGEALAAGTDTGAAPEEGVAEEEPAGPESEVPVHSRPIAPPPVEADTPTLEPPGVAEEDFDIPLVPEDEVGPEPERPRGLYSPASGVGWESYMQERLDAEIARSASFEQDLSLLLLSYDGLSSQDAHYGSIGAAITAFFSFRDLAFERGDDGFSVILPNIDSSHALKMAEEFYKKLVFLAGGDYAELGLLPLFIGISSRSGRLVDALRLSGEAEAALERARYEKDTRIIAFKPDPDKYRLFLAAKGA